MDATPPAAAAREVPTAGVPTYLLDSAPRDTVAVADATTGAGAAGLGADGAAEAEVAAGATAAGAAATSSPSRADISALFSAGKPLRPRRACSAAMVDLLHFRPSATHLATSSEIAPPLTATGAAVTAAGAAATGAAGGGAGAPSPLSQDIG